ncbi:MAG TPA: HAD-IIA family hydrolase [Selenomonadales bacterium]|nr:HAD-IIA family hydrolase [Selenomonadales bacterium]
MIADQYEVFLFDLDGVIYLGERALPGSRACIGRLRELGKKVYFLTNDPRPTRQELSDRLTAMGIPAAREEIVAAGWATAGYLAENGISRAFVIGTEGLFSELRSQGIAINAGGDCQAVVIGYDEGATFGQLQQAVSYIDRGARFIATNADPSFPGPDGRRAATGAVVAAVRAASGKSPIVIGKPGPQLFRAAMRGVAPGTPTVMIGDTPETDILGAHRQGMDAILVAKGRRPFPLKRDYRRPDAVIPDLAALFAPRRSVRRWRQPAFPWPDSIRAGVAAVLLNGQNEVLLVKRNDNGLWSLPSGHVEIGETVAEAIRRELREETGLTVDVQRLIGVYSDPVSQVFAYPSGDVAHFITLCFLCRAAGGELRADRKEIGQAAFFALDRLPAGIMNMHPRWLADALAGQAAAYIR